MMSSPSGAGSSSGRTLPTYAFSLAHPIPVPNTAYSLRSLLVSMSSRRSPSVSIYFIKRTLPLRPAHCQIDITMSVVPGNLDADDDAASLLWSAAAHSSEQGGGGVNLDDDLPFRDLPPPFTVDGPQHVEGVLAPALNPRQMLSQS